MSEGLVGALGVDLGTALRELRGDLFEPGPPLVPLDASGRHRREFAQQQDEAEQVAEDQPLMPGEIAARDVAVKVTAKLQQVGDHPDGSQGDAMHAGVLTVEDHPHLVGEGRWPFAFFGAGLGVEGGVEIAGGEQPSGHNREVDPFAGEGAGGQALGIGDTHMPEERAGQVQHGLEQLQALGFVRQVELLQQEEAEDRVDAAEGEELAEPFGGAGGHRGVDRSLGVWVGDPRNGGFTAGQPLGLNRLDQQAAHVSRASRLGGALRFLGRFFRLGRETGRRGIEFHHAGRVQRQEHRVQHALLLFDPLGVHQPLADQVPQPLHLGRKLQHVRQHPPRQVPLAGEPAGGGGDQLGELRFVPVLAIGIAGGLLALQHFLGGEQPGVAGVFRDRVVLLPPAENADVVLVGQRQHVSLVVKLRSARPAKDLVCRAGLDQLQLRGWPLHQAGEHDRPRGKIDARRERFRAQADREQPLLKQVFDNPPEAGEHSGVMHANAPHENLLQLRPGPVPEVVLGQFSRKGLLLARLEQRAALEFFRDAPAFVPAEAEDQGGGEPEVGGTVGHLFEQFVQGLIADPAEVERNLAFLALDEVEIATVAGFQPAEEFDGVSHRRREEHQPHMRGEQREREFPDDAPLGVGEAVEFIHHHGIDPVELFERALQQAVEENFGDHHQDGGLGVDPAVARHEADLLGSSSPADDTFGQLAEFLLGERDERRGVVHPPAGPQRFVDRRLGDQRFARARGGRDQDAFGRLEPGEQGPFLDRVGNERELLEVREGQLFAREPRVGLIHDR